MTCLTQCKFHNYYCICTFRSEHEENRNVVPRDDHDDGDNDGADTIDVL